MKWALGHNILESSIFNRSYLPTVSEWQRRYLALLASSKESAAKGNGTHQKSFNSDKWLLFLPIKYMAAEAAKERTPRIVQRPFLFMFKQFG